MKLRWFYKRGTSAMVRHREDGKHYDEQYGFYTPSRTIRWGSGHGIITAKVVLHTLGYQDPYLSITAEIKGGNRNDSASGCLHEEVAKAFPEIAHLLKWHLTDGVSGMPMHYKANGLYWLQMHTKRKALSSEPYEWVDNGGPHPLEAFMNTVVFGAVEGDKLPGTDEAMRWMVRREIPLRRAFLRDLKSVGLA
jgi:hypothetical protein